jgi:hypothetical protein
MATEIFRAVITGKNNLSVGFTTSHKIAALKPRKFTVVLILLKADRAAWIRFCNQFCEAVCNSVVDLG